MAKSASKHRANNRSGNKLHEDLLRASCPTPFGSAELFKIIPDDFVSTEQTLREWHTEVPFTDLRMEPRKKIR